MSAARKKDPTKLSAKEIKEFRAKLTQQHDELVSKARETMAITHAEDDVVHQGGDEVDQSTAEYEQAFEYRLRDREKFLLKKIAKALARLDDGTYNVCEDCEGPIGVRRLRARSVATLCIECKEEQEADEKKYQKRRAYKLDFDL